MKFQFASKHFAGKHFSSRHWRRGTTAISGTLGGRITVGKRLGASTTSKQLGGTTEGKG